MGQRIKHGLALDGEQAAPIDLVQCVIGLLKVNAPLAHGQSCGRINLLAVMDLNGRGHCHRMDVDQCARWPNSESQKSLYNSPRIGSVF